jgi:hypothetical protein
VLNKFLYIIKYNIRDNIKTIEMDNELIIPFNNEWQLMDQYTYKLNLDPLCTKAKFNPLALVKLYVTDAVFQFDYNKKHSAHILDNESNEQNNNDQSKQTVSNHIDGSGFANGGDFDGGSFLLLASSITRSYIGITMKLHLDMFMIHNSFVYTGQITLNQKQKPQFVLYSPINVWDRVNL